MEPSETAPADQAPAAATGPRRPPDLTTGPIPRGLLVFTLPMLGANLLQSLNGTANAAWVSHILGPAALTATAGVENYRDGFDDT